MQPGQLNLSWAKTLVDQLIKQGVTYFCLSPGSRSTPLVLAIAENPKAEVFIHFDERGSAFHALGYAKATGKPAAVLVTSGTAVGNLMPAVMEAWAAHVPLILLTADRPAELRDVMANQTADQLKMFGDYLNYFFDLPSPSSSLPQNFLGTSIAQLVNRSQYPVRGPVQLNCPYPEPFFGNEEPVALDCVTTNYTLPELSLSQADNQRWAEELSQIENGMIVIGANGGCEEIGALAEKLGWPVFADINSSYRHLAKGHTIRYYHHILKSLPDLRADAIFHFGDACVSKILYQWVSRHPRVIQVASHPKRSDPLHCVTDRVICHPRTFCEGVMSMIEEKGKGWFQHWEKLSGLVSPTFEEGLSEPRVVEVIEGLNTRSALFFANSMPIRDADMFLFPKEPCGPIFANRGLSGIDGNIATIAGIAQKLPVIAVIGDQTFLHDLNSLAQLKKTKHPVKLIVINNGGGGIFSFLAIGERKDVLDQFFAGAHEMHFEKAAELFDLEYEHPKTVDELSEVLHREGSCLIEVKTNREENLKLHKEIDQQIKTALCSSFSMVS